MDLGVISIRYARALLKSAVQKECEERVYGEMMTLSRAYIDVPELRKSIINPMLSVENKKSIFVAACGNEPSELTLRFFDVVLNEHREDAMQFIASSYITLYRKQKNITHGRLVTAAAVSPATEQNMRRLVEERTKGTVEFLTEVDPDIIGGFILEYDTYRMDASIKNQLANVLKKLSK